MAASLQGSSIKNSGAQDIPPSVPEALPGFWKYWPMGQSSQPPPSSGSPELPLAGSRLNPVYRVGETVRRVAGPWTPTVHALLRHVRERGFSLAPEPLDVDEQGREVLSFLPGETLAGTMPWPDWVWDDGLLADIGGVAAAYHRAAADFAPGPDAVWQWDAARPATIVCHHDLAPYNVVVNSGRITGIIDWDLAGPGTPRSELAFVAWQWVPLQHPSIARMFGWRIEPDYSRRLRILLDAYGLEDRQGFIAEVIARIAYNRDNIARRARSGMEAYIQLERDGHLTGMNMAIEFLANEMAGFPPEMQ